MKRTRTTHRRHGLSLLEVLVALATMGLSLAALFQIINMGSEQAVEVRRQSEATQIAQSKLAEVVAGVVALQSQDRTPWDEENNSDWYWSMDADDPASAG